MPRPNILIFMSDQQRGDTVPPWGRAQTPNLERLCREGISFRNAHCPSPHCCPSRATFHSGLYPSEHGVWNNVDVGNALSRGPFADVRLFSEDLREAGYRLDFSGKWHVSSLRTAADYGWTVGWPEARPTLPPERMPDAHPPTYEWEVYERVAELPEPVARGEGEIVRPGYDRYTHYGGDKHFIAEFDRAVVDDALRVIRERGRGGAPWCQFVGTLGPHDPYYVPPEYLEQYPLDSIELPASWTDRMDDKPALYRRTRDRFDQLTEREQREALRHYLAFCTFEDDLFGRVFSALRDAGQLDNTLVLYVSDHGDYAGEHGLWCKGLPCFRGAYHVPAIAWWPEGIARPGREVDAFVSLADFAPTFLELAETAVDRPLTGRSLVPFLRGEEPAAWRDEIHTQTNGNELYGIQRSVTTREWKYVYNGFDYDELYDLTTDPEETRNLARDPAHQEVVRQMCRRMWRFAHEHGDVPINGYIMVGHAPFGPAEAFR